MSFPLANSHKCLTPWSVFQDGSMKTVTAGSHKPLGPRDASLEGQNQQASDAPGPHPTFSGERPFLRSTIQAFDEPLRLRFRQASSALASPHCFLLNGFKSFDPLFKVLFTFPSQYLFAIGFPSIFSLGRSISPDLGTNPKVPDSTDSPSGLGTQHGGITLFAGLFQEHLCVPSTLWIWSYSLQLDARSGPILSLSSSLFVRHY